MATKRNLDWPEEEFYIPQAVKTYFEEKLQRDKKLEEEWWVRFRLWAKSHPELYADYQKMVDHSIPDTLEEELWGLNIKTPSAGREASHVVINYLAERLPQLYGGSADLSTSDKTLIQKGGIIGPKHFKGRNIKFGVREFGMATIANGLALSEMITPFIGTFLTFSDYMRNAIRLAALSRIRVIYQFTHDSIFLGEDGPTHQSVEHYAALRAIPHLQVIRPADNNEVKMAWIAALRYEGPTAIILSRQSLPTLEQTALPYAEGMGRGGYIIRREHGQPDYTLFATGSELVLALSVAEQLEKRGKVVRVVSMPCWELFEKQDLHYRASVVGGNLGQRVSIEAGVDLGWHKYIGREGRAICMEGFGLSAPAGMLKDEFGFNVDAILEQI